MSVTQSKNYAINCIFKSGDGHSLFTIEIDSNESVCALKERIKEREPTSFSGVDAYTLELYRIDIPQSEDINKLLEVANAKMQDLSQALELDPTLDLADSKVFGEDMPPENTIHIIVVSPRSALTSSGVARTRNGASSGRRQKSHNA